MFAHCVHSHRPHRRPKAAATQVLTSRRVEEHDEVHLHEGMSFSHRKDILTLLQHGSVNMLNKPDMKGQILCDSAHRRKQEIDGGGNGLG